MDGEYTNKYSDIHHFLLYKWGDYVVRTAVSKRNKRGRIYGVLIFVAIIATITLFPSEAIRNVIGAGRIKPLNKRTIAIDPGHGGIDGGTYYGDILEKDINLLIGLKLKEQLTKKGAKVIMTREIDDSLEDYISNGSRHSRDLKARVKIIEKSKADIFISIHVNYIKNIKRMGAIAFYYENSETGKLLAEEIQTYLNELSRYKEMGIELKRLPMTGDFYILKNTSIPGVIIETGFISNSSDRKLLLDESHQNEIVDLIIKGIIDYFNM